MKPLALVKLLCLAGGLGFSAIAQQPLQDPFVKTPMQVAPNESDESIQKKLYAIFGQDPNITFVAARSSAGDTASGVVVSRTTSAIAIDVTPCLPRKTVVTFVAPYKESSISDERCGDKPYPRVQVIQLGPGWK